MKNIKGFSIVEIIITVSIIILLGVIAYSSKLGYDEKVTNGKIISDTKSIDNALISYIQENSTLPMPKGNTNYFSVDTSYVHSYDDVDTFGVYGSLTEETLPKKYIQVLPIDPRTNSYYSYGKTKKGNEFEVASIQVMDSTNIAQVIGNYKAENGPYNLIREYNGSNFVYDGSEKNFPYNPDELILIATTSTGKIYRAGDTITVETGSTLEIFFSDGSVSVLGNNTQETKITLNELNFKGKDNLNTIVKLFLASGEIWTKATKLNKDSEFEISTTDSTAAVRGTIFGVIKTPSEFKTQTIVAEGIVDINTTNADETPEGIPTTLETIEVIKGKKSISLNTKNNSKYGKKFELDEIEIPIFSNIKEKRSDETLENIKCKSFYIDGECMDKENSLKDEKWNLYAYAPYDKDGDINMYSSDGIINISSGGILLNTTNLPGYCIQGLSNISNSFCDTKTTKGIFINTGTIDFINYTNLGLGNNFAIEMNIYFPTTNPQSTRYLFNINSGGFKTYLVEPGYIYINNDNHVVNNFYSGGFHKILIKTVNNSYSLFIDELLTGTGTNASTSISSLFIGGKNNLTNQLNDIIDYVKIYSLN